MEINEYGRVKIIEWSDNITTQELIECSHVLKLWAAHDQDYAIVSLMPKDGKSVGSLSSILSIFRSLRGSKLHIYGIGSSYVASFMAKIVNRILQLQLTEATDHESLIEAIKADNDDFRRDMEKYHLAEKIRELLVEG